MSKLNDLNGKEWVIKTKSWFIINPSPRGNELVKHPAKYPEELVERYVEFFTRKGESVFDPFLGVASTLVGAENLGRSGLGIEINEKYCDIAQNRVKNSKIILGDSRKKKHYKDIHTQFILTSPPYWNMLRKKRGNSNSQHNDRVSKQLDLFYSDLTEDIGNIEDYGIFLNQLKKVFVNCYDILDNKRYVVIVAQNFRNSDGKYITYAWDIVKIMKEIGFYFEGEQIWCQENKKLGIWGFPTTFISNIHHHYCLIFRKNA